MAKKTIKKEVLIQIFTQHPEVDFTTQAGEYVAP
jgi:hypothetical protein